MEGHSSAEGIVSGRVSLHVDHERYTILYSDVQENQKNPLSQFYMAIGQEDHSVLF